MSSALFLLTLAGIPGGAAENRWVQIINRSSKPIYYFYASNVDRGTWEQDILGNRVLLPNQYANVNIDDNSGHCRFDLRAVLSDGREAKQHDFNVCVQNSWTVVD